MEGFRNESDPEELTPTAIVESLSVVTDEEGKVTARHLAITDPDGVTHVVDTSDMTFVEIELPNPPRYES